MSCVKEPVVSDDNSFPEYVQCYNTCFKSMDRDYVNGEVEKKTNADARIPS